MAWAATLVLDTLIHHPSNDHPCHTLFHIVSCFEQTVCTPSDQFGNTGFTFMSGCGLGRMESWEDLDPVEKDELASVFSGQLHDLVVCVAPLLSIFVHP